MPADGFVEPGIRRRTLKSGRVVYDAVWQDGKHRRQTRGFAKKSDARSHRTAMLAARDRGEHTRPSTGTFGAYAAAWLDWKKPRLETSTWRTYDGHLRLRLEPAFGRMRLRDVTRERIDRFVSREAAAGRVGAKTINDTVQVLRMILGHAQRAGLNPTNPAAADRDNPITLPYELPESKHLTPEQSRAYVAAWPERLRALAEIGPRIGEAVALEWPDVDLDALTIRIRRSRKIGEPGQGAKIGGTKGNAERIVHISPELGAVLAAHRRASDPRSLVFTSTVGTMLNPSNLRNREHARAVKAIGLDDWISLHAATRHTAGTIAASTASESLNFVKAQLGHANVKTTQRYAHIDHAAHAAAAARVGRIRHGE